MKSSNLMKSFFNISFFLLVLCFQCIFCQHSLGDNVVTPGTSIKISSGTTIVSCENLVIKNGASIENSGTAILKKNLSNENVAQSFLGNGVFGLLGSNSQSIIGSSIFNHLTVNNNSGITINGNTHVNGNLSLIDGKVFLGSNNLTLGSTAIILGIPSASVMIIPTGTGELRKVFSVGFTGGFTFPVGDNTFPAEYSPVILVVNSGTFTIENYIGVRLKNEKYPDHNITGNYLNRYWSLSYFGITGLNCNATFQYLQADVIGSENLLSCTKVNPLPWSTYSLANTSLNQLNAIGLTGFSSFTGLKTTSVPVVQELVNVVISQGLTNCYDAQQLLTVAGNGSSFIVQNGGHVTLIAGQKISMLPGVLVNSGGYLLAKISTSFCNNISNSFVNSSELNTKEIEPLTPINKSSWIQIYPNPTQDLLTLEFHSTQIPNVAHVSIFNLQGQAILHKDLKDESKHQFSLSDLPVGVYVIKVTTSDRMEIAKIVKK